MEKFIALVTGIISGLKEAYTKASSFTSSKTGKFVLFAAFTLLVAGWSFHKGKVHSDIEIASLQLQLKGAQAEAATNKRAYDAEHLKADKAHGDLKVAQGISADLQKKVDDYVSNLGKRKGGACTISPADTRGLLSIR